MAIDRTREIRSGSAPAWKKTPTSPAKRASEEEAKAKPLETGGSDEIVVAGMGAPAVKTATDSVLPKSEEAEAETATETTVAEESREASTEIVEQEKDTSLFGFLGDMFHSGVEKVSGVLGEVTSVVKDIPDFLGWIISGITGFLSDLFGFGGNDDDSPDTSSTVEPASAPLPTPEPTESPKEPDASEPTTGEPGIVEDVAPDATEPTIVRVNPVDEPDDEAVIAEDTVTYDLDVAEEVDPKPTITTRVKDESITSGPDDTVIAEGDVGESDEATVAVVETEIDPPDGSATKESFVSAAQDTASYIVGELFGFRPASAEEDAIAEGPELTAQDRNARLRHLRMQAEGISSKRFREYQEQESALVKAEENSAALAQKLEAAEASMAQARQAASAEVEALQTQLVEARELAKTDAATAADQQSRIAELTTQLRAAKAKQNLQAQQDTRTISDLRKQLRQADLDKEAVEAGNRKAITQLTRKLEQAEVNAAEAETKIDLMEGRILTLAQERNALRAQRDTEVRLALEKASDARKELRQRDLDLKNARDELVELTEKHLEAEAAFKQQADADAETRRRLELAAQNLLAKKNEAETRLNLQERQHVVQIGDLNRSIRQARQDARVLQEQANEKIDALTSELELAKSQLKQQSQTLAATEDALSQKTEALEQANAQTAEAQAREAALSQELVDANEKIENAEAARVAMEAEAQRQYARVNEELATVTQQSEKIRTQARLAQQEHRQEVEKLQHALDAEMAQVAQITLERDQVTDLTDAMRGHFAQQIETAHANIETMRNALWEEKTAAHETEQAHQASLAAAEEKIATLQQEATQTAQQAETQRSQMAQEIAQLQESLDTNASALTDSNQQAQELSQQLDVARFELHQMTERLQQSSDLAQRQQAGLNRQLTLAQNDMAHLNQELAEMRTHAAKQAEELEASQASKELALQKAAEAKEAYTNLQAAHNEMVAVAEKRHAELTAELTKETQEHRATKMAAASEQQSYTDEIAALESELAEAQHSLVQAKAMGEAKQEHFAQQQELTQARIAELQFAIKEKSLAAQEASRQHAATMKTAEATIAKLEAEAAEQTRQAAVQQAKLTGDIEDLQVKLETTTQALESSQGDSEALRQQLNVAQFQLHNLKEKTEKSTELAEHRQAGLQRQLVSTQTALTEARQELENQASALEQAQADKQAALQQAQRNAQALETTENAFHAYRQTSETIIGNLHGEMAAAEQQLLNTQAAARLAQRKATAEMSELTTALDGAKQTAVNLSQQLSEAGGQNAALNQQLAETQARIDTLTEQLDAKALANQEMQARSEQQAAEAQAKITVLQQATQQAKTEFAQQQATLVQQIEELESQLTNATGNAEGLQQQVAALKNQLANTTQQNQVATQSLENQVSNLQGQIITANQRNERLTQQLALSQEAASARSAELAKMQVKFVEQQQQLAELREKVFIQDHTAAMKTYQQSRVEAAEMQVARIQDTKLAQYAGAAERSMSREEQLEANQVAPVEIISASVEPVQIIKPEPPTNVIYPESSVAVAIERIRPETVPYERQSSLAVPQKPTPFTTGAIKPAPYKYSEVLTAESTPATTAPRVALENALVESTQTAEVLRPTNLPATAVQVDRVDLHSVAEATSPLQVTEAGMGIGFLGTTGETIQNSFAADMTRGVVHPIMNGAEDTVNFVLEGADSLSSVLGLDGEQYVLSFENGIIPTLEWGKPNVSKVSLPNMAAPKSTEAQVLGVATATTVGVLSLPKNTLKAATDLTRGKTPEIVTQVKKLATDHDHFELIKNYASGLLDDALGWITGGSGNLVPAVIKNRIVGQH